MRITAEFCLPNSTVASVVKDGESLKKKVIFLLLLYFLPLLLGLPPSSQVFCIRGTRVCARVRVRAHVCVRGGSHSA